MTSFDDRKFHVEQSSADPVPESARHGQPRELFTFWLTTATNFGAITIGGIAIALGLDFWQGLIAVALGAVSFVALGATSILGPRFGLPTMAICDRVFGRQANKVNATIAWILTLGWAAVGLVIGALSFQSIVTYYDPTASSDLTRVGGLLIMAVLLFVASLFGHATLKSIEGWLGYVFVVIVVVVCVALWQHGVFGHLDLTHPAGPLAGSGVWATFAIGATILISSGGLSWAYMGAEYARYLPSASSSWRVGWCTTIGGALPALLLPILGLVLALSGHFTDPIADIPKVVPAWIGVPFLIFAIVSTAAGYVPNLYSAGLNLLVIGVPVRRTVSIGIVFVIATLGAIYALFVSNFITSFEEFLSLSVVWIAPWLTVVLLYVFLRHIRGESPVRDVYWPTCVALALGFVVAFLCSNDSPLWVGPIAKALGGGDISIYASSIVAAVTMFVLEFRRTPSRSGSSFPSRDAREAEAV